MTERRFYKLEHTGTMEAAMKIARMAYQRGMQVGITVPDEAFARQLDHGLWKTDAFLPHARVGDWTAKYAPVQIAAKDETAELTAACHIVMTPDQVAPCAGSNLVCYIFPADDDEAVNAFRAHWRQWKSENLHLTYWSEQEGGGWKKDAEINQP